MAFYFKISRFFFLVFSFSISYAQSFKIGANIDVRKRDLYLNAQGLYQQNRHQLGMSTGFGLFRAFVQHQAFGQLAVSYEYSLLKKKQFELFTNITVNYNTMQLGKSTKQRLHVLEELAGLSYEIGKKWRFKNTILLGMYSEFLTPSPKNSWLGDNFDFQCTFGFVYEI
jgi:hypothetical protein